MKQIRNEQPIANCDEDALGLAAWSRRIATMVATPPGPLTVGVLGPWGIGKTSVLRMVDAELSAMGASDAGKDTATRTEKRVVTVWFDLGQYENETTPLGALLVSMLVALRRYEKTDYAHALANALRGLLAGFSMSWELGVPGFTRFRGAFDAAKALNREDQLRQIEQLELVTAHAQALRELKPGNLKLVVLIDDLDRCLPERAVHLLEQIKLVLKHPDIVFVVALDSTPIEAAVARRIAGQHDSSALALAKQYMDKLIHVPLSLSHSRESFSDFAGTQLVSDAHAVPREIPAEARDELAAALEFNPRRLIRIANELRIWDSAVDMTTLEGRAVLTTWGVADELRERYRDVYKVLLRSPEVCEALVGVNTVGDVRRRVLELEKGNRLSPLVGCASPLVAVSGTASLEMGLLLVSMPGQAWLADEHLRAALDRYLEYFAWGCDELRKALERLESDDETEALAALQNTSALVMACPRLGAEVGDGLRKCLGHASAQVREEASRLLAARCDKQ